MRIGTRLLLYLLPTIAVIMTTYTVVRLRARERTLLPVAQQEAHAYATTLALAFEFALRDANRANIGSLLNQISEAPTLFGIAIYDSTGATWYASEMLDRAEPPPARDLAIALARDTVITLRRIIDGQGIVSVVRNVRTQSGQSVGALEVAQPLAFIAAEQDELRRGLWLNTAALLVGVTLVTLWLVNRIVTLPLDRLLTATRSLGRGDLSTRVPARIGGGEIRTLARELNGMAMNLEAARSALVRENDERVLLERRLRAQEQLATIGRLAAGVAHEIAAPLNVISGRAELLLNRAHRNPDDARSLRIVVDQIRRIAAIVRNLLDFARRPELTSQRLELVAVIEGASELLEAEFLAAGVEFEVRREQAIWIDGDPDQLHQVFVNLFLNAVQAMEGSPHPKRLVVSVALRGGDEPATDGIGIHADVLIQDSGPGIPSAAFDKIFDPFFTTKITGTGLGLVVVRSIIEAHGGSIVAEPSPGAGAAFRLSLPAAPLNEMVYG
jgi:signal transduction histidine kinase